MMLARSSPNVSPSRRAIVWRMSTKCSVPEISWRISMTASRRSRSFSSSSTRAASAAAASTGGVVIRPQASGTAGTASSSLEAQQSLRVAAQDLRLVGRAQLQGADAVEHRLHAADLVRVVAAREHVLRAREFDREPQRAHVEVHGVVVEVPEVLARRPLDVGAALAERVEAAVQPLGDI